jgi:site-specific DNA-methyltransferase (adenine-specific)
VRNIIRGEQTEITRCLSEYPVFVRSNVSINLIRKIMANEFISLSCKVYPSNPFGFRTYIRGEEKEFFGSTKLITSEGTGYVKRSDIGKSIDAIDTYNVIMTRAMSGGNKPGTDGKYQIVPATMRVMEPNEICVETYICIGNYQTKNEAQNLKGYLSTMFARFLMLQAMSSIMINKDAFQFVPLQDFSHPWTDEMLYKKYDLNDDEIAFIESMIRPME